MATHPFAYALANPLAAFLDKPAAGNPAGTR